MTLLDEGTATDAPAGDDEAVSADAVSVSATSEGATPLGGLGTVAAEPPSKPSIQVLGVAFLSSTSAALSVGGVFASWPARLLSVGAVAVGIAWAYLCATRAR